MSEPLENLRAAYRVLEANVIRTLRTQVGAPTQLGLQVDEALRFLNAAEQVCVCSTVLYFSPSEYATMETSINTMVDQLDEARHLSSDPPEGTSLVVSTRTLTGGRPRVDIDPSFLSQALALRGTTHLENIFNCSARTIRRRALEYGIADPGHPVYTDTPLADGSSVRTYSSSAPAVSTLTDEELDTILTDILTVFPDFGRRMISGCLKAAGHRVPRDRIRASYIRIVIHCFIDGKSRLITGIRVSNNNAAETVLSLFREATGRHGFPSRVSSVHNTRIERLWYDITHGFGQKWKNFFVDLEVNHGLNPLIPSHIWLLHHLFLDHINSDAQEWAEAWNSHNIHIRGERERSPRDMFLFSMVQDGPRGIQHLTEPVSDEVEDPNTYGIDWDEADNSQMMDHLLGENPHEWEDNNPFSAAPGTLSHVPCDPPNCPFTPEQVRLP
ncbi:hypothetical protein C8J57DRAFT_1084558 [Mycena rebaudengoi]|nr:hypothetical protein C8J57DRAFT_1084558 [Mycena rebaudengoi]